MTDVLDRLRAYRENKPSLPISIPEWGFGDGEGMEKAFVKPVSASKAAHLRKVYGNSDSRIAAQTIIHCLVDASGKPVFSDDVKTMAELESQNWALVRRVFSEIAEKTGDGTDLEDAKN